MQIRFSSTNQHYKEDDKIRLLKIKNNSGEWVENPKQIRSTVEDHCKCLFTTQGPKDWRVILECIEPSVTPKMNSSLICQIQMKKLNSSISNGGSKSPEAYGFRGVFYQSY